MQKINLKTTLISTVLAAFAVVLFAGSVGEVRAEGDEGKFSVTLNAPFEKGEDKITGDDGGEILQNYASALYKWLAGFIGLAAVLLIVVGGIQISTAGANQEGLQSGKDRILAALVGLALLFLSGLILFTINPTFFN